MENPIFSSNNLDNFIRNKKLKEIFTKMDFNHVSKLVKKIAESATTTDNIDIEMIDAELLISSTDHIEKLLTFNESLNCITTVDKRMFILDNIVKELKENTFNIRGKIHKISTRLNKEKDIEGIQFTLDVLRFDVDIVLRDDECEYNIHLWKIKGELMENLNKFSKNSIIYFTNMRASLEQIDKEYILTFRHLTSTKVYLQNSALADKNVPLVFNKTIKELYEIEQKKKLEKKHLENSRLAVTTSRVVNTNMYNQNHVIDLTKQNEGEFIDVISSNDLNDCLSQIPNKLKDISELLVKEVEHSIYGMTNAININNIKEVKDVCGMIKTYKVEEKLATIELISLKDSNTIKILHYNKNVYLDLKENMIIVIKNIALRINKNFDIVLENPNEHHIKIVGLLNNDEAIKLKRFRFDKNKEIDCIIDLTIPVVKRNIHKYLITIKKIYKIQAIFENNYGAIPGYPDLKLIAKCLVDDGTFEANMFFYDQTVINFLRIPKEQINLILDMAKESCNLVIYDKFNTYKVLPKDCFENIFVTQFIVYCVPYSNLAKKHFFDNNYNRYFDNLGYNNNLRNKALNMAFINGDIVFDNTPIGSTLLPRPFLKGIHLEIID